MNCRVAVSAQKLKVVPAERDCRVVYVVRSQVLYVVHDLSGADFSAIEAALA